MKKIVIISAVFLFLVGCGVYNIGSSENPKYVSLDEALVHGRELYYFSYANLCIPYLQDLKRQATNEEDKVIIDRKMAECLEKEQKETAAYEQQIQQEREEQERLERERVEYYRIEFETRMKELIQNSNGTLEDKSAQQVKKLIVSWKDCWQSWVYGGFSAEWPEKEKSFSLETFYKIFGKAMKKQLLSEHNLYGGKSYYYYFLYRCKDGVVQIKVNANKLDHDGIVVIEDLNIF